jgi:acylphosphatase
VQGVYYRASTVQAATRLALSGWARNLRDGTVEVVAEGPPDALSALATWLWQGPPSAVVESVTVEEWQGSVPSGFGVK